MYLKKLYFFLMRRLEAWWESGSYVYEVRKQLLARVKEQGLEAPELEGLEARTTAKLRALRRFFLRY